MPKVYGNSAIDHSPELQSTAGNDPAVSSLVMALVALVLGLQFTTSFVFLTVSLALCVVATALPSLRKKDWGSREATAAVLACGLVIQAFYVLLLPHEMFRPLGVAGVAMMSVLGLLQLFSLRRIRIPLIIALAAMFLFATRPRVRSGHPHNDVYDLLQQSSAGLVHGSNPYELHLRNTYGDYFGPGGVDKNGYLAYGFPYPPLNVVMVGLQ